MIGGHDGYTWTTLYDKVAFDVISCSFSTRRLSPTIYCTLVGSYKLLTNVFIVYTFSHSNRLSQCNLAVALVPPSKLLAPVMAYCTSCGTCKLPYCSQSNRMSSRRWESTVLSPVRREGCASSCGQTLVGTLKVSLVQKYHCIHFFFFAPKTFGILYRTEAAK